MVTMNQIRKKNKIEIWKSFEKLIKLEKNVDENTFKDEVGEIINLLETLTKKDLADLKQGIQQNEQQRWNPVRSPEVQEWIDIASNNLKNLPDNDKNWVANRALKKIHEYLW